MATNEPLFMLNTSSSNKTDEQETTIEPILLLFAGSGQGENNTEITEDDVYDYDFNSSFNNYDWAELIPAVVVYSFVLLLGISGNGKTDDVL